MSKGISVINFNTKKYIFYILKDINLHCGKLAFDKLAYNSNSDYLELSAIR